MTRYTHKLYRDNAIAEAQAKAQAAAAVATAQAAAKRNTLLAIDYAIKACWLKYKNTSVVELNKFAIELFERIDYSNQTNNPYVPFYAFTHNEFIDGCNYEAYTIKKADEVQAIAAQFNDKLLRSYRWISTLTNTVVVVLNVEHALDSVQSATEITQSVAHNGSYATAANLVKQIASKSQNKEDAVIYNLIAAALYLC